jgi:hypothetical protein
MWWVRLHTGLEKFFPNPGKINIVQATAGSARTAAVASGNTTRDAAGKSVGDEVGDISTAEMQKNLAQDKEVIFKINANESIEDDWGEHKGIEFQRYTTLEAAHASSELFREAIDKEEFVWADTLKTTERALDIFLSCFAPEKLDSLPTIGYQLVNRGKKKLQFVEIPLKITMSDLFALYTLAAELQSAKVCNMVINAWRKILVDEAVLRKEYQTGVRKFTDPAITSITGILDFKAADMNALFLDASVRDEFAAAREFWLDVLIAKEDMGFLKITDDLCKYHRDFIQEWVSCLSDDKAKEVLQEQELEERNAAYILRSVNSNIFLDNWDDSVDDDCDMSSCASEDDDIPMTEDDNKNAHTNNNDSYIDTLTPDNGSASGNGEDVDPDSEGDDCDSDRSEPGGDTQGFLAAELLALLLGGSDEEFCRKYHVHGNDEEGCTTPISASGPSTCRGLPGPRDHPTT